MGLLPKEIKILPPTDDRIFMSILTSPAAKPFLIRLIAASINREVQNVTILNSVIPISDTQEKLQRFDMNVTTDDGTQVNMEMQASRMLEEVKKEHKNLKARIIYYLCDLHSSQPAMGQERYDKLARTYQVLFCAYPILQRRKDYVNTYSMRNDKDYELLHDAVQNVIIELSRRKLRALLSKPVETMTDLEKFSVFLAHAANPAQRDTVNKIIESEEVLMMAADLLMNISQDERERALFRSRKKYQMDMASNLATARDNGRNEGIASTANRMLKRGYPIDEIVEISGLTREQVQALAERHNRT